MSSCFIKLIESIRVSEFWGAFWGAFLAFIFGLIAYRATKRWERFILHKNSLVKMERVLNFHLQELGFANDIIKDSLENLKDNKLTPDRIEKLNILENVDMEFGSLRIINDFMDYKTTVMRFNYNLNSLNHALNRFDEMLLVKPELITRNAEYAIYMLEGFQKDIPKIAESFKDYLIVIRIHIKKIKQKQSFLYGVWNSSWEFEISDKDLKKEREIFEDEVNFLRKNAKETKV